ncbi:CDP-diacylglycerol--glycerol-3-phosphate 3-phosphatidyltransferase [Candidatus Kinetoplastibacterium desouzaii TCC079E]|uniref:CDP-diacylglycerol--glycerol-3-phosphate 3-phosphatidyltransferase n=1 Tax=Candidatus Kinetoplastidibacterium desouzai TCC079E TaxID=1208919 RepID=M1L1W9_9PROT|nr:CDP-diacylglycerol--glycerol-3-phosphate 3-phosphatidyltransferase [Candidatus Kinetoplastibacterium desouzaii]AGF46738.1 CDP-diacylglycerol--glycerol-3-phosphate 3-phosphatidyltransferase [Candidatus Kinetoplastibacterium desouzaii TCC079E]
MLINVPIALTWMRVLLIPMMVCLFYCSNGITEPMRDLFASMLFLFAALTDWLDGWLARRLNQTTSFGAFLDPVADKLMVCSSLIILLELGRIDLLVTLIIIGREITVSALREWMAIMGARASVAVHRIGKIKTMFQMIAIPCLLYGRSILGIDLLFFGNILIIMASILTVWSMLYYIRRAWCILNIKNKNI